MDEMRRDFEQVRLDHQPPCDENEYEVLPPILLPEYADALIDVISKLEPFEFANLSKTCSYLFDFCWNAKGIKIPLNCVVELDEVGISVWTGDKNHFYDNQRNRRELTLPQIGELILKKAKQFQARVEMVSLRNKHPGISWQFAEARRFLGQIGCGTAERLCISFTENRHNRVFSADVIQFFEDFGVKEFYSDSTLENDDVTYLLRNMVSLHLEFNHISNFDLRQKVPTRLHMGGTLLLHQLVEILKSWARCDFDIEEWSFEIWFLGVAFEDMLNHFPSNRILGPFFRFPLPSARPLLLMEYEKFPRYLLRSDGQILGMFFKFYNDDDDTEKVYLRQLKPAFLHRKLPILFPTIEK